MDLTEVASPSGIKPTRYKTGKTTVAVEIESILLQSFFVPRYEVAATGAKATLATIGKPVTVFPLSMLREHTDSNLIRITPPAAIAATSSKSTSKPSGPPITVTDIARETEVANKTGQKVDDDKLFDTVSVEDLSTRDIEMTRTTYVNASSAQNGTLPIRHHKLKNPPKPGTIQDKYSAVLGDPFQAMKCPKSSTTHHKYKKAYNVALQNAFFIWNETKMKQLEDLTRKDGMTEEKIESERYYNAALFKGCVDRFMPSPKHLYWRVRSVFVMYGDLEDPRGETFQ